MIRITATLLTFGEDSLPDAFGDVVTFAPGSLYVDGDAALPLLVQHNADGPAVGVAERVWTEGDAVRAEFVTLDTPAARQVEAELAAGVRWDVSVGVRPEAMTFARRDDEPDALRATVTLADLVETSLCFRGRMPSARVDDVSTDDGGNAE